MQHSCPQTRATLKPDYLKSTIDAMASQPAVCPRTCGWGMQGHTVCKQGHIICKQGYITCKQEHTICKQGHVTCKQGHATQKQTFAATNSLLPQSHFTELVRMSQNHRESGHRQMSRTSQDSKTLISVYRKGDISGNRTRQLIQIQPTLGNHSCNVPGLLAISQSQGVTDVMYIFYIYISSHYNPPHTVINPPP